MVRAEPRRLVGRHERGGDRVAREGAPRRARGGPLGTDARRDAARRRRQAAPSGDPLERRSQRGAMSRRSRRPSRALAPSPATSRCPASPRRSSSGCARTNPTPLRRHALRAAAEGLRAPVDDGREGERCQRRRGHAVGRRCQAPLVARDARRDGLERIAHAAARRRVRCHRQPAQGSRRCLGHGFRAGRGRWRRQCRGRRGHRRRQPRRCIPVARHVGRAVPRHAEIPAERRARRCTRSVTACRASGTR